MAKSLSSIADLALRQPLHQRPDLGLHGTAFGGRDKKTLYAIVFTGAWGTSSARNRVMAIATIAQGYTGRAK